ncbi:MAG: 5'-nucleotidase C-terminal domain-containing protein, partial [Fibrobacteria bacterium]|nr:5'-nucleotidase C-terminal domain-containing protein [Fibrobacteria bacterium]
IILLSHLGFKEDQKIARAFPGIDIIIGGHSNESVKNSMKIGNTHIYQVSEYGKALNVIKTLVDTSANKLLKIKLKVVKASDLPAPDSAVQAIVEKWESKVRDTVDVPLTEIKSSYNRHQVKKLFEKALKEKLKADFGFYNLGGIRDSISPGTLLKRQIWNIEPFSNRAVLVNIPGVTMSDSLKKEMKSKNIKFETDKVFRVATCDFVAQHSKQYLGPEVVNLVPGSDSTLFVRDVVCEYLQKKGAKPK